MPGDYTQLEIQLKHENLQLRQQIMGLIDSMSKAEQRVWDCENLLDEVAKMDPICADGSCVFCGARIWMNGAVESITHEKDCLHEKVRDFVHDGSLHSTRS